MTKDLSATTRTASPGGGGGRRSTVTLTPKWQQAIRRETDPLAPPPPMGEIAFFPTPNLSGGGGEVAPSSPIVSAKRKVLPVSPKTSPKATIPSLSNGSTPPPPVKPSLQADNGSSKAAAAAAVAAPHPMYPPKVPPPPPILPGLSSSNEEGGDNVAVAAARAVSADDDASSELDFSSVSSVASSHFSEMGADEIWEDVPMASPDAILGIAQAFRECDHPSKVNVCVGAYRDAQGKPWVLPSVRQAERLLMEDQEVKEYLPIEGDKEFVQVAMKFAYGPDMPLSHLAAVQTLSGTGACRVAGAFLAQFWPGHPIYIPDPTWGNHLAIFNGAGLNCRRYRYFDRSTNGLALRGMLHDLNRAPDRSIVLLHACAHNPTGCDPTLQEWKQIVSVISKKEHVVLFDSAYQGFASGDAEVDAQPFRYAVAQKVPILLAQSFAKNFGLYGERVGTLSVVCGDEGQKNRLLSLLRAIIRPMYSSPPRHGSSIVKTILRDPALTQQYREECATMAHRIRQMRSKLVAELKEAGSRHDFSHVSTQIGMFAFTGLTPEMCEQLTQEYSIFLTLNGRISVAGLNDSNVRYVAQAIHAVTDGKSITGGQ